MININVSGYVSPRASRLKPNHSADIVPDVKIDPEPKKEPVKIVEPKIEVPSPPVVQPKASAGNTILAIDPGNTFSAYAVIEIDTFKPVQFDKIDNHVLLTMIKSGNFNGVQFCAIEMVACYGMAVGKDVFETVLWIGRFHEAFTHHTAKQAIFVYRKDVKMLLCNSVKAKDSNIRQSLIDRFGTVGTKKEPGFFFGFRNDIWSAFAVGVTAIEQKIKGG
jgi:hypothetical protein